MMTNIRLDWSGEDQFKARVLKKKSVFPQFIKEAGFYTIWFNEAGTLYTCSIPVVDSAPAGSDQEDFEQNYKASFNAKVEMLTLPDNAFRMQTDGADWEFTKGQVTQHDFKVENYAGESFTYKYLSGADWKVLGAVDGDHAKFQVVDKDNILGYGAGLVLVEYVRKKFVFNEVVTECIASAPGQIIVGLYLRCIYTSTGTEVNPRMLINFHLETKG